jgi:hypothetical protein
MSTATDTTMNGKTAIIDAVPRLCERGALILPCDGKRPTHDGWQHRTYSADEVAAELRRVANPTIGLRFGPGSYIDIEADSPDEERAFSELFAGYDVPITPTFASTRGKHRLFAWDDRLAETGAAVVSYRGANGAKLGIRIGAGHKGAQSIIPPSAGRTWLVSWDDCEPAALPDVVIGRILAAANSKPVAKPSTASTNGHATLAVLAAMLRHKPDVKESDGSKRLYAIACRAVEHDLSDATAVDTIRHYEAKHPFPRAYSDGEILARLRDAEKKIERGSAIVIANYEAVEIEDDDGETKTVNVPRSMNDIIDLINQRMGDWPRRVDNMLFVDDPRHGLDYFDRRTTAGLFGWLRRHCKVTWTKGGSLVSQAELFAEIERTANRYEAIELLPHEPPMAGIYYRGQAPKPGDGSHLSKLLDRFRPATTIDRDLIQAAFMTPAWGGLPGCRPAFVVTSDDGRGVGKSKVPETIGYLFGGHIDVSAGEDIEQLKTRMLTPGVRTKRIALLDNVKTLRLSWAELEAMITSPIISGRQLYVGEGQRPNLLTWFITLNGVSMATDMAQRSVIIKVVRGKNDGPWWEQTRQFIDQHRGSIVGDIIAALRAEPFPLSDFSRWATWEQHVLCRLPEPGDAQRLILERQGEANCELDEAEIIEEHFAEQLRRLDYDPQTAQVRIPVATAARWYGWAVGEPTKTAAASKRLHQMAGEGQAKRIAPDSTRTYGRGFIWTGKAADVVGLPIANDLPDRIARMMDSHDS